MNSKSDSFSAVMTDSQEISNHLPNVKQEMEIRVNRSRTSMNTAFEDVEPVDVIVCV